MEIVERDPSAVTESRARAHGYGRGSAVTVSYGGQSNQGHHRILVVDDEIYIADLLATGMRFVGFDVATAHAGIDALAAAAQFRPHLLVLDVMLPDIDGFEVCRQVRVSNPRVGVVFLTARNKTEDAVAGLTVGGDDYINKPFSLDEVVARVRAVLRRLDGASHSDAASGSGQSRRILSFADLELDHDRHEVRRSGTLIELSLTEFSLLRYLMENIDRVVSKAQIIDRVWKYDFRGDPAIVESYISYLRKKIDHIDPPLIHTVRGVGYALRMPRR
jgi:two-component system OmpR family response regulator